MLKSVTALATAAVLAAGVALTPSPADARGGRVAAGILGGLAAGAIIGGALAGPRYYQPYGYYQQPYGAYYAPRCRWERERYWDGYRWRRHRVRVCY